MAPTHVPRSGTLPPQLFANSIIVFRTRVSGTVPQQLGNGTGAEVYGSESGLSDLTAGSSWISGTIPLGPGLSKLQYLTMSSCRISGTLSAHIGDAAALLELDLDQTRISGTAPVFLSELKTLLYLDLPRRMSGTLDGSYMGSIGQLMSLNMDQTRLSGTIR